MDSQSEAEKAKTPGPAAGKRAAVARDWTQGSISRNLLTLAWPVVISNSLNYLGPTIDLIWVGKLGTDAMAAVGISAQVITVVNALLMGLFTSLRAMVARRIGEGDEAGANRAFQQAFTIGIAFSAAMALVGQFLSVPILSMFGAQPDVLALAVLYNRIQFIGMITMTLRMMTEATLQASGDSATAMRIGIFFRILHMVLCPFWVFGWWIFPNLGVVGAATMDIIAQGIGGALGLWVLLGGRSRLHVTFKGFTFDPAKYMATAKNRHSFVD